MLQIAFTPKVFDDYIKGKRHGNAKLPAQAFNQKEGVK